MEATHPIEFFSLFVSFMARLSSFQFLFLCNSFSFAQSSQVCFYNNFFHHLVAFIFFVAIAFSPCSIIFIFFLQYVLLSFGHLFFSFFFGQQLFSSLNHLHFFCSSSFSTRSLIFNAYLLQQLFFLSTSIVIWASPKRIVAILVVLWQCFYFSAFQFCMIL